MFSLSQLPSSRPPVARISAIHRGALLIIDVFATALPDEESSLIRVSKLRRGESRDWTSLRFSTVGFFLSAIFLHAFASKLVK